MKTDASSTGVAAEIWQYCDKSKKYLPVAFASRLLKPLVFGTTEFRHYLAGIKWTLYCDNKAVTSILNRKLRVRALESIIFLTQKLYTHFLLIKPKLLA